MDEEQTALNGLLAQLKEMPAERVIILSLLLSLAIALSAWQSGLAGVVDEVKKLDPEELSEEELMIHKLTSKKLEGDIKDAKLMLQKERKRVVTVAKEKEISVSPNVYALAVSAVNELLDNNHLRLLQYSEDHNKKNNDFSRYVSQFSQQYIVIGEFIDIREFLAEVNHLPYLCRVSMTNLESMDSKELHDYDQRLVKMEFTLTLYYMRAQNNE